MINNNRKSGFITLFFVLSISFTILFWISLSSDRVFENIAIKDGFIKNKEYLNNKMLCADIFVNNVIKSDFNNYYIDNKSTFIRNAYLNDDYVCNINNINIHIINYKIENINFNIDEYGFIYQFNQGFFKSMKSFKLF